MKIKCYTYDDVNIVPKYSEIEHRDKVNIRTQFTKKTEIAYPIVSSPMDTVTGLNMAKAMLEWGTCGVIHRFQSIEKQARMMKSLHYEWDSYWNIGEDTKRTIEIEWDEWWNDFSRSNPPTKEDWKDLKERWWFADSMIDSDSHWDRLPLCAAVGVTGDYLERAQELVKNGCNVLLIDVAHGHHKLVGDAIEEIKTRLSKVEVVAGSVATGEATKYLCEKGADSIRVGIGNGSLCETRIRTGVGIPTVSALLECVAVADSYNTPVIADGGIRNIGDVCKGLACGADSVMLGSILSGTKESPGEIEKIGQWPNEKLFKKYRGSASRDTKRSDKNVEGNHKVVPYKGKTRRILHDIGDGVRSSFSYVGANNIDEFHSLVELVKVTRAGQVEAKPHLL